MKKWNLLLVLAHCTTEKYQHEFTILRFLLKNKWAMTIFHYFGFLQKQIFWYLSVPTILKQKWPNSLCKNIMFLNTIFKNTANQKRDFLLAKIRCIKKNPPFQMFHAIKINPGSLHSLIESKTSFFSSEQLFLSYKSKYEDMKIRCV